MKKGLSLLLAASMAFSAFSTAFAAVPQTTEEKYQALVEAGIFEGFEDGQAHLDQNMTRAQAAKIVALVLGLEEDAAAASIYSDLAGAEWAAGFIGAATEAGVLNGRGNGVFDPSANVTIQELAKIMVEALDIEVDATATVAGADEWAQPYVAAAVAAGIISSSSNYTAPASRSILVDATYVAKAKVEEAQQLTVTATPTAMDTVELKFNRAVDAASKIVVKLGNNTVAPEDTTIAEDGKSATLEFAKDLAEGDYTVTVGEGEEAVSATFEITAEYVAAIEFGEVAPLTRAEDAEEDKVVFAYVTITNQYGEVVTGDYIESNDLELDFSDIADVNGMEVVDADKGVIKLTKEDGEDWDAGEEIRAEADYEDEDDNRLNVQATLTVGQPSEVTEVVVGELVNTEDTKDDTFTFDDTFTDWALIVSAKDQYGNEIGSDDLGLFILNDDIDVNSDDEDIAEIDNEDAPFVEVDYDGDTYTGIRFASPDNDDKVAGESVISFDPTSGDAAEFTLAITDVVRVDTIELKQPASAPADAEEIIIPFVAKDTNGEEVTDDDVLEIIENDPEAGLRDIQSDRDTDLFFRNNPKTNKAELVLELADDVEYEEGDEIDIEIETYTEKVAELTIELDDVTEVTGISGVTDDFHLGYLAGAEGELPFGDIDFVDQFGEEYDADNITLTEDVDAGEVDGEEAEAYRLHVETTNEDVIAISTDGTPDAGVEELYLFEGTETLHVDAGDEAGTARVTLTLQQWNEDENEWEDVGNAAHTLRLSVVEQGDIESYKATVSDAVYVAEEIDGDVNDGSSYSAEIEVVGVLENGDTVFLPADLGAYEVNVDSKGLEVGVNEDKESVLFAQSFDWADEDDTTEEVTVLVVPNADVDPIEVKVTVSDAASETKSIALIDDNNTAGDFEVDENILYVADNDLTTAEFDRILGRALEAKDQYGEVIDLDTNDNDVVSSAELRAHYNIFTRNFSDSDRNSVDEVDVEDEFTVTVYAKDTNKSLQFKVIVASAAEID